MIYTYFEWLQEKKWLYSLINIQNITAKTNTTECSYYFPSVPPVEIKLYWNGKLGILLVKNPVSQTYNASIVWC
jgi:hypothetical protein